MSDQQFDIIFRGDILPDHHISEVKQRLAQLFKADEARINSLFGGAAVPLKRNLDAATAEKYRAALVRAGAQVELAPAGAVKPRPRPAPKRRAASPVTVAQRAPMQPQAQTGWSLAPVGSNLAPKKAEAQTVKVDISGLSLRPREGDLLDDSEKKAEVEVELDLSAFELAEVGVDLINPEERLALPAVEFDTSGFELAPAGSNLSEPRREPPPPAPDTSGISLADPVPQR